MRVELSGKQKCGLGFVWSLAVVFGLMLGIPGCGGSSGDAPSIIAEAPEEMVWEYAIGDKVLHKSGVLGVVIDMDFDCLGGRGFARYAVGENQWDNGKKMQCYCIRVSGENGLTSDWVSVLELEDAPDG